MGTDDVNRAEITVPGLAALRTPPQSSWGTIASAASRVKMKNLALYGATPILGRFSSPVRDRSFRCATDNRDRQ